jgi:aryl-alcohol dehydrogenase-like predicted oxidoreductase
MKYINLGKTGIKVSRLGLGTVELGLDYGINKPENFTKKPNEKDSIYLLHKAVDFGINLFDTAPSYGCSEELLGKAFTNKKNCIIATKVNIPSEGGDCEKFILSSLNRSCKKLQRKYLDILQVHNTTVNTFLNSDIFKILLKEKEAGNIRFIGASVYEPKNAFAAINSGIIDVLQVAYNVLDQRMDEKVLAKAKSEGIGILSRSVFLKGVLTERIKYLPKKCEPLKKAAENVKMKMKLSSWQDLSNFALRFALSNPGINSILVGISNEAELDFALNTFNKGKLNNNKLKLAYHCRMNDNFWLNPSNWEID